MKKIKFIIFAFLSILVFLYNSENFQNYIREFENGSDYVTMYAPAEIDSKEMLYDLMQASDECNVNFFVSEYSNTSTFLSKKTIYYSSVDVIKYINDKYNVNCGRYNSIICGNTDVEFVEISDVSDLPTYNCFWLIGSHDDQINFKSKLISKYGGSVPREGNLHDGTVNNCIKISLLLMAMSLFVSFFQIISNKKEALVRVIYGESKLSYIIKNILQDSSIYVIIFVTVYLSMSKICFADFCINYVKLLFAGMLIINALLYLIMLRFNFKREVIRTHNDNKFLVSSYTIKFIVSVLAINLITVNISVVFEGLKFNSQKTFFESKSEYSYVQNRIKFSERNVDNELINAKYKYRFYQYFTGEGNALMQVYLGNVDVKNNSYPIVYINKNNLIYLLKCIPELNPDDFKENKVYYLFPEKLFNSTDFDTLLYNADDWIRWNLEMHYQYQYEYATLEYHCNTNLIALSNQFEMHSDYVHNPIIAYNNRDESQDNYPITSDIRDIYDKDIMYILSQKEILKLEEQSGYKPESFFLEIHNVYADFQDRMTFIKRITYINSIISLLIIVLNTLMTLLIIALEYSANKVELAIKKTIGYSRIERFKRLHIISASTIIIGSIILLCINTITNLSNSVLIVLCGLLVLTIDYIIINVFEKKADNDNLHKILKGG